jgi:hypothetical protein
MGSERPGDRVRVAGPWPPHSARRPEGWAWEVRVVAEARDDVDVHVGHHVAEADHVDLVRRKRGAEGSFGGVDDSIQGVSLADREVGEFPDVSLEDHAAEAGVSRFVGEHDAAERPAPQDAASVVSAQGAVGEHGRSVSRPDAPRPWTRGPVQWQPCVRHRSLDWHWS